MPRPNQQNALAQPHERAEQGRCSHNARRGQGLWIDIRLIKLLRCNHGDKG